jgi:hypothetical protein
MLFCDIYYVSTDAAYVKNFGGNFIFRPVVMFVILELQIWNAILLKYIVNYDNYVLITIF